MSKIGRYKTPREYTDEDIWFLCFTKKQLIYLGISIFVAIIIFKVMQTIKLTLIGIVLAIIILCAGFCVPRFKMPSDKYLIGGGITLEQLFFRIIIKVFFKKKRLYIIDYTDKEKHF